MSKRQVGWTEEKISRCIKEKRGQGELSNYKPWLTIQDVPSRGRVHREIGWKTSREHHLLSDLEKNYLYICDWADNVIDIREQFPLEREFTVQIAEEIGVKHPLDIKSGTPIVMTTDFLLTIKEGKSSVLKARTIKPAKELNDKRVIEKFEIERLYWERKGIDWGIVTEKEYSKVLIDNLTFLRTRSYHEDDKELNLFLQEWPTFIGPVIENLHLFDKKYNLDDGMGLRLYKKALAKKILKIDMDKDIDLFENAENIEGNPTLSDSKRWA